MIAAYSYSGKTLAAMALAVAIAAGEKVWGQWSVHEPARVMYLDFEQGGGATRRRFQALLKGMGIEPEALGDRLRLGALPTFRLTDQDAEPYLTAACASLGVDLCVIDTLRAATPGEEENDSRMSAWLEMLTRVSEKTGTTFLVIHHAGKKKQGFGPPDPREAPRGSSAVVGACGTVLVMMKEGDAPSEVTFAKLSADADASPPEPFFLAIEPPNGGVRVVYKSKEQVRPPHDPVRELRGDVERLVGAVAADPGVGARALRATLRGMGSERFKTAREEAIRTGRVVVERKGKSEGHFPKPEASGE